MMREPTYSTIGTASRTSLSNSFGGAYESPVPFASPGPSSLTSCPLAYV